MGDIGDVITDTRGFLADPLDRFAQNQRAQQQAQPGGSHGLGDYITQAIDPFTRLQQTQFGPGGSWGRTVGAVPTLDRLEQQGGRFSDPWGDEKKRKAAAAAAGTGTGTGTGGSTLPGAGGGTSTGLAPGVAQWADQTNKTFGDLGADMPDTMLAIMTNESGGKADVVNPAGPAYGLFQLMNYGAGNPNWASDTNGQFQAARQLAQQKLTSIAQSYAANGLNPDARTRARDFALAWAGHFDYDTGRPNPSSRDQGSGQTADQLSAIFLANYDKIKAGRQQAAAPGYGGGGPALTTLFGGGTPPVMQEFGTTDYSVQHPDTYAYGNAYGLVGSQHPGVDYGMDLGTKLYVPVGGTVTVVGNDHGSGYFYTSPMTGGDPDHSGELAITMPNGDIVILGHMGSINLRVGQQVTAGMFAGLSGGSDGAHLHLEVRRKDPTTSSGYRIVDPRGYFGQPTGGGGGQANR